MRFQTCYFPIFMMPGIALCIGICCIIGALYTTYVACSRSRNQAQRIAQLALFNNIVCIVQLVVLYAHDYVMELYGVIMLYVLVSSHQLLVYYVCTTIITPLHTRVGRPPKEFISIFTRMFVIFRVISAIPILSACVYADITNERYYVAFTMSVITYTLFVAIEVFVMSHYYYTNPTI
jgi:F0F1-type ATP synthase membrane subunit c/vacuolar-type H+-ATPase subunit K